MNYDEYQVRVLLKLIPYHDVPAVEEATKNYLNWLFRDNDDFKPEDDFKTKPELVALIDTQYLLRFTNLELPRRELLRRLKEDYEGTSGWNCREAVHVELQDAILTYPQRWHGLRLLLDDAHKTKGYKLYADKLLRQAKDATQGGNFGEGGYHEAYTWIKEDAAFLPHGHGLLLGFFKHLRATLSRYEKDKIKDVAPYLPESYLEKEWANLSEATRAGLLNNPHLSDTMRATCLRVVLRSHKIGGRFKLLYDIPWDMLRAVPHELSYLINIPEFVEENKAKLTGEPIRLEEFKRMCFRSVIKGDSDRRTAVEQAIHRYDKIHVGNEESFNLQEFFTELDKWKENATMIAWWGACGTETAKELAFTLMIETTRELPFAKQKELKAKIDLEPRKLNEFVKRDNLAKQEETE